MVKGRGTDSTVLCLKFAGQLHSEGAKEVRGDAAAGDVVCFFLKMPLQTEGIEAIFQLFYVIYGVCFASFLSCLIHCF